MRIGHSFYNFGYLREFVDEKPFFTLVSCDADQFWRWWNVPKRLIWYFEWKNSLPYGFLEYGLKLLRSAADCFAHALASWFIQLSSCHHLTYKQIQTDDGWWWWWYKWVQSTISILFMVNITAYGDFFVENT